MSRAKDEALLLLEDGSIFFGQCFGSRTQTVGEVVFNTGMVGYCESMTDPSYAGQILCFTYPQLGNYGVPPYGDLDSFGLPRSFESDSIKVKGIVVQEACSVPSHWASRFSLAQWLESEDVPGIQGVDTRALVTKLREAGVMMGVIASGDEARDREALAEQLRKSARYSSQNFVKGVSVSKPIVYGTSDKKVVLLDCGTKFGIIRNLLSRGFEVVRVPYDATYSEVMKYAPAGVVVCNGPGDPQILTGTSDCVGTLVGSDVPVLGICLGQQVVGMSQGVKTFKLPYGHRGQNKPCLDLTTGRGYVTSQNHGYALEMHSLSRSELRPWFVNIDDGTVEGIFHSDKPCIAVQFHPEATPGPYDTDFVFDSFVEMTEGSRFRGEQIRSVRRRRGS